MSPHLAELVTGILIPPVGAEEGVFYVRQIPSFDRHFAGKSRSGTPCLLLYGTGGALRAPLRLAAIEVAFAIPCRVVPADGIERTETLTVVHCTAQDPHSHELFLHVCETILRILGPEPTFDALTTAVQRLVELFQRITKPASRSVTGLFGELLVIDRSPRPPQTLHAWRNAVDDRFDFALDDIRMEVKTAGDRTRSHIFSADQCNPPRHTVGVLVSLFVESSGGGSSVDELVHRVESNLGGDNELILKLQECVADTLGITLPSALRMRFDERLAVSSMQFYDLSKVPAIRGDLPAGVSQVHFRSDLSQCSKSLRSDFVAKSHRLDELLPPEQL